MTITIWLLDPGRVTVSALAPVTDVVEDGSVSHIVPVEFLYRVEKAT